MNCNDFGDPLTFHLVLSSGQNFNLTKNVCLGFRFSRTFADLLVWLQTPKAVIILPDGRIHGQLRTH